MKKITLSLILCASLVSAAETNTTKAAETPQPSAKTKEAIGYIKILGKTLTGELKQHLKADKSGVEAMNFCASSAEALTKKINTKLPKGAKVRRTSLRIRNEANKADETDIKVMEQFTKTIEAGKTLKKPVVIETKTGIRVYKALITQTACLKCHGSNINPKIKELIDKKYPNDKAIGFKEGSLRGVVVSEIAK